MSFSPERSQAFLGLFLHYIVKSFYQFKTSFFFIYISFGIHFLSFLVVFFIFLLFLPFLIFSLSLSFRYTSKAKTLQLCCKIILIYICLQPGHVLYSYSRRHFTMQTHSVLCNKYLIPSKRTKLFIKRSILLPKWDVYTSIYT